MNRNVVVVGGGLAGLAAAIYLARAGRSVTLFEKRRHLGGRAITTLRRGYRFNLGAHLFHRGGAGAVVCRELGIPLRGKVAGARTVALLGDGSFRLPTGWGSLLATTLLSFRGKKELAAAFFRIRRSGGDHVEGSAGHWLDATFTDARARDVMTALLRQATMSDDCDVLDARASLEQVKVSLQHALCIDEGWQKIVDSLQSAAISSGVNFVTSSRIIGVDHDGERVRSIELGGLEFDADRMDTQSLAMPDPAPQGVEGARIPASDVLLAVDPQTAAAMFPSEIDPRWKLARPVTVATLDVALASLPDPRNVLAVSIDQPMQFGVHSAFAQLTPKGGALVHVTRCLRDANGALDADERRPTHAVSATEQSMEELLDRLQPGWRSHVVHRRFLPAMTVANALPAVGARRPSPATPIRGLYVAGDWVGDEGMLADASLASARAAARAILAAT